MALLLYPHPLKCYSIHNGAVGFTRSGVLDYAMAAIIVFPYEPEDSRRHMENVLRWFDNMNNIVPTWYLKGFYIQWTDDVPYKLKAPFDFSFLSKYGKVFRSLTTKTPAISVSA